MKTMKRLDKERRKLEKVGFSGQTLERAMELLERTNASILSELLVKMVTRQEKTPSMALYEMETKTRELEAKLGGGQGQGKQFGADVLFHVFHLLRKWCFSFVFCF